MDKYIYNEKNGLWYELQGDYYLPCLKLPEEGEVHIGIWGQRHLRYLKQYHRVRYYNLLTSGKLNSYLADIDRQAEEMFPRLVKQMAESENINKELKATDTTAWIGKMNNVRNRAAEVVSEEIIYK
jgi:hypothetical protein